MSAAATFARGSAGLFALFSVLKEKYGAGEVIVPALCCEAVAMAACYAGHDVRFADVGPGSPCITPETVMPLISDRTRAVVVVHLYGVETATSAFAQLRCLYPKAMFIEDIAHSLGGRTPNGVLLGGGLDITLLSFANDKIIQGDGGALLFSEAHANLSCAVLEAVGPGDRAVCSRLALSMRNLVHAVADCWREGRLYSIPPVFAEMLPAYRTLLAMPGGVADESLALGGLAALEKNRESRYRRYRTYADGIDPRMASVMQLHEGSTCWRCSVTFPSAQAADAATRAVREAGLPASNHYFPLNLLFGGASLPNAEDYSRRVVNLWVDASVTTAGVAQTIKIINRT
jgi:dTDP-4-amino-4,6-dideoxygalactose transaminase